MREYAHENIEPRSEFIRYRGATGQIDMKDTVVAILSAKPGLTAHDVADLIVDKEVLPRSYAYVHEVLRNLERDELIVKNEDFYYLLRDAVQHDMEVTLSSAKKLTDAGISLKETTFLSSGIVMAAEAAVAESEGRTYDPTFTVAADAVCLEIDEDWDDDEEGELGWDDEDDDDEIGAIGNPFEVLSDSDTEDLKLQAIDDIKEEAAQEARAKKLARLRTVTDATQLLGQEVEILIPGITAKVVGTILELRPTGCNFLITYSEEPGIAEGTVMPLEYSKGFAYKLID